MEAALPALPVVAVMVVQQPSLGIHDALDPDFAATVASLAAQDHPRLKVLMLLVGAPGTDHGALPDRIRDLIPSAVVRVIDGNPGFGAAANEAARLVRGSGVFCFLHDDVVLAPDTIRVLADELVQSNAGIVGPKFVEWSEPAILQSVGLAVDRGGEVDALVDVGEVDQGQHDGVRDVFAVPTACLMVRADLFTDIGGFDPVIEFAGDDVDLCWRAHLAGARVLVVAGAAVRHRGALWMRRPDLNLAAMAARARMRSVATLTGTSRLVWALPHLVLVTLAEAVVGAVTGRIRDAAVSVRALVGMVPRLGASMARRRRIAELRRVPDAEVASLQQGGSARLSRYVRSRDRDSGDVEEGNERRWRQSAGGARLLALGTLFVLTLLGSRTLISGTLPGVGQIVPIPASPWHLAHDYLSGWNAHGAGTSSPMPTATALIAVLSVVTLFHMALLHTALIVSAYLIGALGAWRLAAVFPSTRARVITLAVYALVPLPSALLSSGRVSALSVYAALPWAVHLLRRLAGLDTRWVDRDEPGAPLDGVRPVPAEKRRWLFARLVFVVACAAAFAPVFPLLVLGVSVVLALATLLAGGLVRPAWQVVVDAVGALLAAFVLHLPWSLTFIGHGGIAALVGVAPNSGSGIGVRRLLEMKVGVVNLPTLAAALLIPVFVAPLVARSWRFAWAVRAGALVAVFGVLAVLDDRQAFPFHLPEAGVMLVPVAVGMALAAGCLSSSFEADVLVGSFGWRQLLGVVAAGACLVGVVPGALAPIGGRWSTPTHTVQSALVQLPRPTDTAASGTIDQQRVLWIGDPRAIPAASEQLAPGIGIAITDLGGTPEHADLWVNAWATRPDTVGQHVTEALRSMRDGDTNRLGRLLAPYSIRFILVPLADGAVGTLNRPLSAPEGLAAALDEQLDLAAPLSRPPNFLVYENTAAAPVRSMLSLSGAEGSRKAGAASIAQSDLSGSHAVTDTAQPGTLHLAVPYNAGWHVSVGGKAVAPRRAFGATMAFDLNAAGPLRVWFERPVSRVLWVVVQSLLWVVLVLVALRVRLHRRRDRWVYDPSAWGDMPTTIIDLDTTGGIDR